MSGAIPPLPQYAFMAWSLVKARGQFYLLCSTYGSDEKFLRNFGRKT
jgi:hypothetical protein